MNRWKLSIPVLACVAFFGCAATVEPAAEPEGQPAEVQATAAPPAEQVEVVPVAPAADYVWIRGHWHWNGGGWVWIRGHYARPRVGWHWVPAHYAARGPVWVYIGGHWAR